MGDNKINKKVWQISIMCILAIILVILGVYFVIEKKDVLNAILSYTLSIVNIAVSLPSLIQYIKKKKSNKTNLKQEEKNRGKFIKWWDRNFRWVLFGVILLSVFFVVSLSYKIYKNRKDQETILQKQIDSLAVLERQHEDEIKQDSIATVERQRHFDDMAANYDNRMKQQMTYENSYQLLAGDYHLLLRMIQMLDEDPEIKAESKYLYIDCFKHRADTAIMIINKAIYDPTLTSSECERLSNKYKPRIQEIERMRDAL